VSAVKAGLVPGCAASILPNGKAIPFPMLQWTRLSDVEAVPVAGVQNIQPGEMTLTLADRAALALDMDPKDGASAVQAFPSNVPLVFARYNPVDKKLRIDIFKLEKAAVNNQMRTGVYHASFTPAHGDLWKAATAYIHPEQRQKGNTEGKNPFSEFG